MARDVVTICNLALGRMKGELIDSLSEASAAAESCRVLYPHVRDAVLEEYPWHFCRRTQVLAPIDEKPVEWEYLFQYPSDCLSLRYMIPTDKNGETVSRGGFSDHDRIYAEYLVTTDSTGAKSIASNHEFLIACYTRKVEDTTLWNSMVDDMIAWRLASELAITLGGDSGARYREVALNEYNKSKAIAHAKVANEKYPRKRHEMPRSIQARGEQIINRDDVIRSRRS